MLILEAALAFVSILATDTPPNLTQSAQIPVPIVLQVGDPVAIATSIRSDLESLTGPGSVDVIFVRGSLFNVRIAVPSLRSGVCDPIYDRELKLYRLFPGLNFDFYLRLKH